MRPVQSMCARLRIRMGRQPGGDLGESGRQARSAASACEASRSRRRDPDEARARSSRVRVLLALCTVALVVVTCTADITAKGLKGDGPTSIAVGFGSVWVGFGSGVIVRFDGSSGNAQASIGGVAYVHGIAAASGAIWVVIENKWRPCPAWILRIFDWCQC